MKSEKYQQIDPCSRDSNDVEDSLRSYAVVQLKTLVDMVEEARTTAPSGVPSPSYAVDSGPSLIKGIAMGGSKR